MRKKCHECEFCKTYADKKGVTSRLFTMVCTKDSPDDLVVDVYDGYIDKKQWESLECVKEIEYGDN